MILPIIAYGDPILKQVAKEINKDYPKLNELIERMFETMYAANGVGLAAPQVNHSICLFIIDTHELKDKLKENEKPVKQIFINAKITEKAGENIMFNEGCLSIPDIREDIDRPSKIRIQYLDENFKHHEKEFDRIAARVIQHEYDHTEGILFIDYLKPLKKRLLKNRLMDISRGEIEVDYKMKFPVKKK